tara:strand:- start:144 stop:338 length:195 start_codon:yes stop_codon:yes gene_type:complete
MTRLLTTAEAADYLRRAPSTLERLAYTGKGPHYVGGGKGNPRLYRIEDLNTWLAEQTEQAKAAQ